MLSRLSILSLNLPNGLLILNLITCLLYLVKLDILVFYIYIRQFFISLIFSILR